MFQGGSELAAVSSFFNQPAENLGNDVSIKLHLARAADCSSTVLI